VTAPGALLAFTVRGMPQTQGSARAFIAGKGERARAIIATEANRPRSPLGAWRSAIRASADLAMQAAGAERLFDGPLRIELAFTLPRPRSHYGAHGLKPNAPTYAATTPDLDKLIRAALDALKGLVIVDDRMVAELDARKLYGELPGLEVRLFVPGSLEAAAWAGNSMRA
jgi:Holliday junction resolvase RusA-like endonuclease